jgi:hypothetical protein
VGLWRKERRGMNDIVTLVKGISYGSFCANKLHGDSPVDINSVVDKLIASTGKKPIDVACLFLVDGIHSNGSLKDLIPQLHV